jgi:hypothetical protein
MTTGVRFAGIGLLVALLAGRVVLAAAADQGQAADYLKASTEDMQWWRDGKFGISMFWGPCNAFLRRKMGAEAHDNLCRQFSAEKYNIDDLLATYRVVQSRDAVFMLNVGPRPFGDIHPDEQRVLRGTESAVSNLSSRTARNVSGISLGTNGRAMPSQQ